MNVVDAIIGLLLRQVNLQSVVSGRIYPRAPQNAVYPQIIVTQVSGVPVVALDGVDGLTRGRLQLSCTARTYGDAKNLADLVTSKTPTGINGYRGNPGIRLSCWIDAEMDEAEAPRDAADIAKYHTHLDLVVWYGR